MIDPPSPSPPAAGADAPDHVVVAMGSAGDVLPLAALARRLAERGRRVWLLAPRIFEVEALKTPGIAFHSILEEPEVRDGLADPALWHPQKGIEVVFRLTGDSFARTVQILEPLAAAGGPPPCLVASTFAYGARVAQERWGWPTATVDVSSAWLFSADDPAAFSRMEWIRWLSKPWRAKVWSFIETRFLDPVAAPRLDACRAQSGLPQARRIVGRWSRSRDMVIGLYPAWFAPAPADAPSNMLLAGFARAEPPQVGVDASLDAFLGTDRRTVLFMAGSQMRHAQSFFSRGLEAAGRLGLRALLLGHGAVQAAAKSPHAFGADFVPLAAVLPRCAATVSHPGIGTIAHGLAAGVPQVLTPYGFDHFENARRAAALGVAEVIPPAGSARRMARAIERMVADPRVALACRDVSARIASEPDGTLIACEAIEALRARSLSGAAAAA